MIFLHSSDFMLNKIVDQSKVNGEDDGEDGGEDCHWN